MMEFQGSTWRRVRRMVVDEGRDKTALAIVRNFFVLRQWNNEGQRVAVFNLESHTKN